MVLLLALTIPSVATASTLGVVDDDDDDDEEEEEEKRGGREAITAAAKRLQKRAKSLTLSLSLPGVDRVAHSQVVICTWPSVAAAAARGNDYGGFCSCFRCSTELADNTELARMQMEMEVPLMLMKCTHCTHRCALLCCCPLAHQKSCVAPTADRLSSSVRFIRLSERTKINPVSHSFTHSLHLLYPLDSDTENANFHEMSEISILQCVLMALLLCTRAS